MACGGRGGDVGGSEAPPSGILAQTALGEGKARLNSSVIYQAPVPTVVAGILGVITHNQAYLGQQMSLPEAAHGCEHRNLHGFGP